MKHFLPMLLVLLWTFSSHAQTCGCDYTVTSSGYYGPGNLPVQPGQTVCIQAGQYTNLQFSNLSGTPANPIIFKNCGGVVEIENNTSTDALAFANCKYFKVTGTGSSQQTYGIHVKGTGSGRMGLSVMDKSTNCEIDHLEINNAGFAGIMTKTDPWCDPATWRENFTMYNVNIHDNYIHDCGGEGIYAGNSFWGGGSTINCNGTSITVYPHKIVGLTIHHNLVERTGAEGIQYGCSPDAKVHDNIVNSPGISPFANYQNNGIQIGDGSGGELYNNTIKDAPGVGIIFLSFAANQKIYNNLIVRSGSTGLFADKRVGSFPESTLKVYNNTFISPGGDAILLYSTENAHYITNNALIAPASGQYIKTAAGVNTQNNNNFMGGVAAASFVGANDFHPTSISPLLNQGLSIPDLTFDRDGNVRPLQNAFDIGCYEVVSTLNTDTTACHATITTSGYYSASTLNVQPGQRVCIQAGSYTNLYLANFSGTASAPITFKNFGGKVSISNTNNDGIVFNNCKNIVFTGSGVDSIAYGIVVNKTGSGRMGMLISSLSTDVEVDHVEIGNAGYVGIMAKTDPTCDPSTQRGQFVMKGIKLHDNYIHDTGGPGIFAGHTSYGAGVTVTCSGASQNVYPHLMQGLKVFRNVLSRTGTTGILYASAADAEVYGNTITQAGYQNYNMGIQIGDGTGGYCYNNKIRQTTGSGIYITSMVADLSVYNNLVVENSAYGIVSTSGAGGVNGTKLRILNNTVVPTGQAAIHLTNTLPRVQVYNNAMASPNGQYLQYASGVNLLQAGNYQNTIPNTKFENLQDYLPKDDSPLVNSGIKIDSLGIVTDLLGTARPQQGSYDIGCYEKIIATSLSFVKQSELIESDATSTLSISPNPFSNKVSVSVPDGHLQYLYVYDMQSHLLRTQNLVGTKVSLDLQELPVGMYMISIPTQNGVLTQKVIKY
ncbi:right-handed parallel beta-helix repeat-containing protein [Siphonobacter sp. SORGH_AS_1065]|uniref:right-handed parallel beta-helix repeat-containing protein n=1 Tax=Siphonobacter sp. SORGH_AS_1065 TaxID=3041795 RepID=UPI0027839E21|nr:right-handed parallel beta-helix repeat-containing protein [Siphonobacter sp. SORGH_AS_1065]MDQ1087231.1 hypothetical protein [Siphonobacter sp. SORGH_AS_1065]